MFNEDFDVILECAHNMRLNLIRKLALDNEFIHQERLTYIDGLIDQVLVLKNKTIAA